MCRRRLFRNTPHPQWLVFACAPWLLPALASAQPAPDSVADPPAEDAPSIEEPESEPEPPSSEEPEAAPSEEPDEPPTAPPEAPLSEEPDTPPADEPTDGPEAPVEAFPEPPEEALLTEEPEEEITVSGSRLPRAPGSAHVIGRKQLERFEYDDSQAILIQVPGVYVRQEDGIGLRPNIGLRGVSPDRSKKVTLLEDGILFGPAPYSAPAAYFFPLMTRMTQVRVIKGPSAIAYGPQTVGGAIDFISRPIPTETSGGIDVGLGTFGYGKAHGYFGSSDGQVGFLVEGVRLRNTGFKELPNGADTGSTRNEWVAKASYVLDPTADVLNELRIKLSYTDEVSNETYLGLTDADFRQDPYRRYAASALDQMKNHRTGIVATHVLDVLSSEVKLTTSAYRFDLTRTWNKLNHFGPGAPPIAEVLQDPDAYPEEYYGVLTGLDAATPSETLYIGPNARDFVSQGVQTKLDWSTRSGSLDHQVEAGLRLHYDEIRRRHSESGYLMADGKLIPDGGPTVVTAKSRAATHALAVHVLDAITWQRLTLTPGIRVELIRAQTEDFRNGGSAEHFVHAVLPGMGAFYGVTDNFGVLAGVHRGFSPPAPPSPGKPTNAEPEYSVNYEAGARYKAGAATLEWIGFFNDYSNLTSICTLAGGCVSENLDRQSDAGAARIYGLEVFAGHELPVGTVTVPFTAAYTLTRSRFERNFTSDDPTFGEVRAGYELPYVPLHQLVATLGIETQQAGAVISANYVSPMREIAGDAPLDETIATDPLFWLDAGATLRTLEFLTVYVNVRNVLGAERIVSRRPYGARPNPPQWIQVGLKANF